MKHKAEVKTFLIRLFCDIKSCNAEMNFTGEVLMTCPPKYVHVCRMCDEKQTHLEQYPKISYENR